LDSKECAKRKLTFVAWDCIEGLPKEYNTLFSKLGKLEDLGFFCPPVETKDTASSEKEAIDKIIETAHMAEYPIDGVVFKFNNCDYYNSLGRTEHHFKGGLAYKFYDEEYKTELLDIDFNVSRMGVLTPVAVFKPIEIDGAEVSRASLHNMSIMWELLGKYPELYQPVYVVKSNQIIPQITRAKYKNDIPHDHILNSYPMTCPICGGFTSLSSSSDNAVTLYCDNPNCEGKIINRLDHFCGKKGLDIKGLSKATLEKLLDWGWIIDEESIFELGLYRDEWIKKPGFGEKSVDKILIAIQNACQCDLDAFISALGIPLIGRNVAKEICKNLATNDEFSYDEFRSLIINKFDFTEWEGFGEEKASSLLKFDYTTADIIANRYLTFNEKEKVEEGGLNDLIFVITGKLKNYKNRDALKLEIESRGGKVSGSVSSKTNYLINNDTTSESAKNLSAKKLGIPIISEGEFIEKFLK
jgi:DNA ligase (NAD+)